tara:strand:+ start:626 stop:1033 length:408 start_codon:yes stop_codon:yes gene_type:complete
MSTLSVATVKSISSAAPVFQNSSGTEKGQLTKAWVNLDGNGTVNMRASFNVSSVTDNSTGNYTVNFANNFSDANYIATGFAHRNDAGRVLINIDQLVTQTSSAYRFKTSGTINAQVVGLSVVDPSYIYIAFFGAN